MALVRCSECGQEISSGCTQCPHCGKKRTTGATKGLLIFMLVLLVLALVSCSTMKPNSSSNGYSRQYNNDANYRRNIDSVADTYGEDSKAIDKIVQFFADYSQNH